MNIVILQYEFIKIWTVLVKIIKGYKDIKSLNKNIMLNIFVTVVYVRVGGSYLTRPKTLVYSNWFSRLKFEALKAIVDVKLVQRYFSQAKSVNQSKQHPSQNSNKLKTTKKIKARTALKEKPKGSTERQVYLKWQLPCHSC